MATVKLRGGDDNKNADGSFGVPSADRLTRQS
jgi:hypothetical protein